MRYILGWFGLLYHRCGVFVLAWWCLFAGLVFGWVFDCEFWVFVILWVFVMLGCMVLGCCA